jgi:WD40 repeat protein
MQRYSFVCLSASLLAVGKLDADDLRDRFGVPMPKSAAARLECARLREPESARLQTAGRPNHVAFSPDGKMLASSCDNHPVRFWHPLTGEELPSPDTPIACDYELLFSADSKALFTVSRDGARAVDPLSGQVRFALEGAQKRIWSLRLSPDGKMLAALDQDRTLTLWDPQTGKILRTHPLNNGEPSELAFTRDGKDIIVSGRDGTLCFLDPLSGKERRRLESPDIWFSTLVVHPDGKTLATYARGLELWDLTRGTVRLRLEGWPRVMAYSPDGKLLALTGTKTRGTGLSLLDADSGRLLSHVGNTWGGPNSIVFSPDGSRLAWANINQPAIGMARVVEGKLDEIKPEKLLPLQTAFSPDGKELVTSGDRTLRFWDVAKGNELRRWREYPFALTVLVPAPDGRTFALGGDGPTIHLVDSKSGEERRVLMPTERRTRSLAWSRDGKRLATGHDSVIRLWDPTVGKEERRLAGHTAAVRGLGFTTDGTWLVSVGEDRSIRVWDITTGAERVRSPVQDSGLSALALSPDGRSCAVGDWQGHIVLWSLLDEAGTPRLKELSRITAHEDNVSALLWLPGGKTVASASWDRTVRLWDVATGKERLALQGHGDEVCSLALSPNGERLASGSRDHSVLIWQLPSER